MKEGWGPIWSSPAPSILLQPGLLCLRSFYFNQASFFGHGPAEDDKLDSLPQLWIQSDSWRCSLFWSWSGFTVEIFGHLKSQHLSISEPSFKVLALFEKHDLIHQRKNETSKYSASFILCSYEARQLKVHHERFFSEKIVIFGPLSITHFPNTDCSLKFKLDFIKMSRKSYWRSPSSLGG